MRIDIRILTFLIPFLFVLESCTTNNYSYDPQKGQEFIPIKRMETINKEKKTVSQYVLVKNAPINLDARKDMMLEYAKEQISQLDSTYNDYWVRFFRYGKETAHYLEHEYRKDWTGERYILYSSDEPWNDTRFELGYLFSTRSQKDTTLLDIYIDVSLQEDPKEDYTIGNSRRFKILESISHIKQLEHCTLSCN